MTLSTFSSSALTRVSNALSTGPAPAPVALRPGGGTPLSSATEPFRYTPSVRFTILLSSPLRTVWYTSCRWMWCLSHASSDSHRPLAMSVTSCLTRRYLSRASLYHICHTRRSSDSGAGRPYLTRWCDWRTITGLNSGSLSKALRAARKTIISCFLSWKRFVEVGYSVSMMSGRVFSSTGWGFFMMAFHSSLSLPCASLISA
mmetsp:Transcript_8542/g.21349  ORF Transcript_8542/g.21349 Transcript_8542/m.21349 type:complete len:202 (-) Transcript_8542:131-736(-)